MRAYEITGKSPISEARTAWPLDPVNVKASDERLADYIYEQAQPWMLSTDTGQLRVYRGVSRGYDPVFTAPVRQDRLPTDTPEDKHRAFNAIIAAAGGRANRSNAAFVSGDKGFASGYGDVYVFIPLGQFHFTWSPLYRDWTSDFELDAMTELMKPGVQNPADLAKYAQRQIDNFLERASYSEDYETRAQAARLQDPNSSEYREMFAYYRDVAKERVVSPNPEDYRPEAVRVQIRVDDDLNRAIRSGHEIMIQAQTGLYIDTPIYDRVIKHLG